MIYFADQQSIYMFGGANASGPRNDFFRLDVPTLTWEEIQGVPAEIKPREMHSMELTNLGEILIVGGRYIANNLIA